MVYQFESMYLALNISITASYYPKFISNITYNFDSVKEKCLSLMILIINLIKVLSKNVRFEISALIF